MQTTERQGLDRVDMQSSDLLIPVGMQANNR